MLYVKLLQLQNQLKIGTDNGNFQQRTTAIHTNMHGYITQLEQNKNYILKTNTTERK